MKMCYIYTYIGADLCPIPIKSIGNKIPILNEKSIGNKIQILNETRLNRGSDFNREIWMVLGWDWKGWEN